ncbi:MAG: alpha/beta fold hydrolase [Thermodesulfobacteriota bacterium]
MRATIDLSARRRNALRATRLLLALSLAIAATAARAGAASENRVIFVHGGFGSAGQFESQAMRFSSNGYPTSHLAALEYDSTFGVESFDEVLAKLDVLIAELLEETGARQVDLMGHSLGTRVSQEYLASPERAANVGHYVNIDGGQADAPPGGVPTLAIWAGRGEPGRRIVGAVNVTLPNQTHVEAATSPAAFAAMYRFLTGHEPATLNVAPESGRIVVEGRAVLFPQNVGVEGATLELWEVRRGTGRRLRSRPHESVVLPADGAFGPFTLGARRSYELVLRREGSARVHRFYGEPLVRSNRFLRLLTSEPGGAIDNLIEKSDRHAAMTIIRYKELWGDQGVESDVLQVNGANVINAATSPIDNRTIGLFVFDEGSDGVSELDAPISTIFGIPFLTGVDHYVPADPEGSGTTTVALKPRGRLASGRSVSFPSTASTAAAISVRLNDYDVEPERRALSGRRVAVPLERGAP